MNINYLDKLVSIAVEKELKSKWYLRSFKDDIKQDVLLKILKDRIELSEVHKYLNFFIKNIITKNYTGYKGEIKTHPKTAFNNSITGGYNDETTSKNT